MGGVSARALGACALAVIIGGCAAKPGAGKVKDELAKRTSDWQSSWTAVADPATGNEVPFDVTKRLGGVYVTDERLLSFDLMSPAQTRIIGWAAFKELWGPFMANVSNLRWTPLADFRHGGEGNTGWSAGTVHLSAMAGGQPLEMLVHATLIWERTGSGWKILHEHISSPVKDISGNPVPPQAAALTR
jgi:ketosteroid isomerase-like protein